MHPNLHVEMPIGELELTQQKAKSSNYFDRTDSNSLTNQPESKSFMATALAWHGSVTSRVLPRVGISAVYAAAVYFTASFFPNFSLPITPFEYSGAVLGLLLVMRVNAGHDRWWEARKIWGGILNQSRNLALIVWNYSSVRDETTATTLKWIASMPHVIREYLRKENGLKDVVALVGSVEAEKIRKSEHMPFYVGSQIASLLKIHRDRGMDPFAFHRAETERSLLVDAIGSCERIRSTRMPLVLAIKTRRFILLFILLLPLALVNRAGWLTPIVVALTSYPLFSLDEIGAELQSPFSPRNLSHLPLGDICRMITNNILGLLNMETRSLPTPKTTEPVKA